MALATAALLFAVAKETHSATLSTIAIALLAALSLAIYWTARKDSFPLILFTLCYILFLASRQIMNIALGTPADEIGVLGIGAHNEESVVAANGTILLGLAGILIGWLMPRTKGNKREGLCRTTKRDAAMKITGAIFLLGALPQAYMHLQAAQTVADEGFFSGRLSAADAPLAVRTASALFDFAFLALLSLRPSPRLAAAASGLYLFINAASLFTLSRSDFMLTVGLLLTYFYHRQEALGERWFTKGRIFTGLLLAPSLLALMNVLGSQRGRSTSTSTGLLGPLVDFVRSQGVSAQVVVATHEYSEYLPPTHGYTLGPIADSFERFRGILAGQAPPPFSGQNSFRALEGHQYSHTISYLIAPLDYLQGIGYGSSFIAELLVDFGPLGVLIGAVVYGMVLTRLPKFAKKGPFCTFLALVSIRGFLFAPRAGFIQPIADLITPPSIIALTILGIALMAADRRDRGNAPPRGPRLDREPPRRARNRVERESMLEAPGRTNA